MAYCASNFRYLPFDPLTSLTYGNGLPLQRAFDPDYRLSAQGVGAVQSLSYATSIRKWLLPGNEWNLLELNLGRKGTTLIFYPKSRPTGAGQSLPRT